MTETSLKSGCKFGDECNFRHNEAGGQISKKAMKSDGKGSVASKKENIQLRCVSQDSSQRKSILRENRKLRSNHTVKLSQIKMRHEKVRETTGCIAGNRS